MQVPDKMNNNNNVKHLGGEDVRVVKSRILNKLSERFSVRGHIFRPRRPQSRFSLFESLRVRVRMKSSGAFYDAPASCNRRIRRVKERVK